MDWIPEKRGDRPFEPVDRFRRNRPCPTCEPKADEGEAIVGRRELGFRGLDPKTQSRCEIGRHIPEGPLRLRLVAGEHHEVIGIAHVRETLGFKRRVESGEIQVGQDGRDRRSLG